MQIGIVIYNAVRFMAITLGLGEKLEYYHSRILEVEAVNGLSRKGV